MNGAFEAGKPMDRRDASLSPLNAFDPMEMGSINVAARAALVNRTHRVVRERAGQIVEQTDAERFRLRLREAPVETQSRGSRSGALEQFSAGRLHRVLPGLPSVVGG